MAARRKYHLARLHFEMQPLLDELSLEWQACAQEFDFMVVVRTVMVTGTA